MLHEQAFGLAARFAIALSLAGCSAGPSPSPSPSGSASPDASGGGDASGSTGDAWVPPVDGGQASTPDASAETDPPGGSDAAMEASLVDVNVGEVSLPDGAVDQVPPGYKGTPFKGAPQLIPGTVHMSDYDNGGAGVAYCHGSAANCGMGITTGDWRPGGFPPYRPVAAGGTACGGAACNDNAGICHMSATEPDNYASGPQAGTLVTPQDVYVCYAATGEWLKYTVEVAETGTYAIGGQMAVPGGTAISLDFGGGVTTGSILLPASPTAACKCPETYHSWQDLQNLATIDLQAGTYVMTLTFVTGQCNPDTITFTKQ